jgi:hypothetical protein
VQGTGRVGQNRTGTVRQQNWESGETALGDRETGRQNFIEKYGLVVI